MSTPTQENKPATATPASVPAFDPAQAFDSFAALALSRSAVKLESANYSDAAGYRQDRRTIEKQTAGLRSALRDFAASPRSWHTPEDAPRLRDNARAAGWQLIASALSERFSFNPCRLEWEYCAGQYQPTEIRGAAERVARAARRHVEPVKDYDTARFQAQRLGWVMKDAGRKLNEMLRGIARCPGIPSGYYSPELTRKRSRCLLNLARVLHEEIKTACKVALNWPHAPMLNDPDGLRFISSASCNLVKDAERVAALADDPLPGWEKGAALADYARKLYPNPDVQDAGIYS